MIQRRVSRRRDSYGGQRITATTIRRRSHEKKLPTEGAEVNQICVNQYSMIVLDEERIFCLGM